jgi:hypothetical protein
MPRLCFLVAKFATILMHPSGYRPERNAAHQSTLFVHPLILGEFRKADADYLEACRVKRNIVEYTVVVVTRLSLPSNCTIERVDTNDAIEQMVAQLENFLKTKRTKEKTVVKLKELGLKSQTGKLRK